MQYYRVPRKLDGKQLFKTGSGPRIPNGYSLIQNELLTEAEARRINAPIDLLEAVTIKKTETYRMFGARFAIGSDWK